MTPSGAFSMHEGMCLSAAREACLAENVAVIFQIAIRWMIDCSSATPQCAVKCIANQVASRHVGAPGQASWRGQASLGVLGVAFHPECPRISRCARGAIPVVPPM